MADYNPTILTRQDVRRDGRDQARKTVASDKLLSVPTIVQTDLGSGTVGVSQLKYETASITISGASTSGTATVTSGDIVLGYYLSAFTTPAASYVQLAVSGTTLTATLSTAPGGGNSVTIVVTLLKT